MRNSNPKFRLPAREPVERPLSPAVRRLRLARIRRASLTLGGFMFVPGSGRCLRQEPNRSWSLPFLMWSGLQRVGDYIRR